MWGLIDDSFIVKGIIQNLEQNHPDSIASWFNLGDKDLAYCLFRSYLRNQGNSLTESIKIITKKLGIKAKIYPMADSPIGTYFLGTNGEEYHLEEYFIKLQTKPAIKEIKFKGVEEAQVSPELIDELKKADLIIIGPSNPVSSIGPILKIKQIHNEIKNNHCPKLVISPIIGTSPVSGPAHKYMKAEGYEVSPLGVYSYYKDIGTHFLFDTSDSPFFKDQLEKNAKKNQKIFFDDIIIPTKEKQVNLANIILNLDYKVYKKVE